MGVRARVGHDVLRALRRRPRLVALILRSVRFVVPCSLRVALYRSFSWPFARALSTRVEIDSVAGRMEVDTGDTVGRVIAVSGVWEPHITALVRRVVRPGDVVVDIGAHVGYYTLLAARLVEDSGHVYAFEPSRARADEIRAHVARNRLRNVTLLEVAAGSTDGTTTLYEAPRANTSASTVVERALDPDAAATKYSATRVAVVRADSRIRPEHLDRIRLVKVDVEGYEVEAVEGLAAVLAGRQPLCLIVEISPDWSSTDPAGYLEGLCRAHGFVPWRIRNEYTLDDYFPRAVESPVHLDAFPDTRADVALVRGLDLSSR